MITYLKFEFFFGLLGLLLTFTRLAHSEYPIASEKTRSVEVVGLVISLATWAWVAWLLFVDKGGAS